MSMTWFRFHAEFLHNRKVQTLPDDQFKILVNLMCFACKNGNVPWNVSETLYDLRECNEMNVSSAFHEFVKREILETDDETFPETFHFKNWDKYQYKSDTSTKRVQAHRKKMKREMKRFSNVSETDQRTETETDINSLSDARRANQNNEKVNFLEWLGGGDEKLKAPPEEWRKFCENEMSWDDSQIKTTWKSFTIHQTSKDARKKSDWPAAWKLWCANERVSQPSSPAPGVQKPAAKHQRSAYIQAGAGEKIQKQMEENARKYAEKSENGGGK